MGTVQSVERAFAVLRTLASGPAGVTDIAERTALPKSTVSRLLGTMLDLGVVDQTGNGGEYRIGATLVELVGSGDTTSNLVAIARPYLAELSDALGEATGISVLDRGFVHYLAQVDGTHAVRVHDWTGERVPAHLVPSGLVLLAELPAAATRQLLVGPLAATTARSMTDAEMLRRRLARIAKQGVEWVHEEFADGISSVAAVVRDRRGVALAAVHAHGPSYRFPGDRHPDDVARQVSATAALIAERLAG